MKHKKIVFILHFTLYSLFFIFCSFSIGDFKLKSCVASARADNPSSHYTAKEKEEISDYQSKFANILNKYRFNGTALVAKAGEVIFKKAQGYSNFKTKEELNENTTFQLASVSKQFTAMAIMLLHEKGKLNYNDLVIKYIPEFPYHNITIKNLLSHTSGIPNYIYLVEHYYPQQDAANKKNESPNEYVLNLFKAHPLPLNFKPGSSFLYSNTGYVFLALIVERITKTPFKSYLKTNIFEKLSMSHTFLYDKKVIDTVSNRALSYQIYKGKKQANWKQIDEDVKDDILGDKGVFSTIDDLYKWDRALYDNRLVSASTINEAYEETTLNNKKTREYGYGWRIKNDKGLKIIYHNGWWHGYKTSITRFIEDKNTIIILNNTNSHIKGIIEDMKKVLYPS